MSVVLNLELIEGNILSKADQAGFQILRERDDAFHVFPCEDVATPLMGSTARNDRGCRALVVESAAMHKRSKSQRTANGEAHPTAGASTTPSLQERLMEKEERQTLVVWRRPFLTLRYFILETIALIAHHTQRVWDHKKVMGSLILITICLYFLSTSTGPHQQVVETIVGITSWCLWWVWLGILSSVGLGTGLHTFLLYLGPHIASVTMAAYACNSLDFPAPPYPDEIICPEEGPPSRAVSILSIMAKVRLEAFMWGAGTALGELPPYFMARGARLSGYDPDDEEMAEFESLQRLKDRPNGAALSWVDRAKLSVEKLVERVGFMGILACASIPNPLFDLAGVTCGHFLVPFWTFFGATLIGKAVVKMHIQKLFVIVAFNEALLSRAVDTLALIPALGPLLEEPFRAFLEKQRRRFRRQPGSTHSSDPRGSESILSWLFEKLILAMILYFVLSIINSLAQNYHKRMKKRERERKLATD